MDEKKIITAIRDIDQRNRISDGMNLFTILTIFLGFTSFLTLLTPYPFLLWFPLSFSIISFVAFLLLYLAFDKKQRIIESKYGKRPNLLKEKAEGK